MKKSLLIILFGLFAYVGKAQPTNFIHTSGRNILGPCGDVLNLKGINYAPYNWGYSLLDENIDQIAQTGANAVRLVWYWSNPGANVYYDYVALDSILSKVVQHDMIAILELHDFTCENDPSQLAAGSAWWQNSFVFPIISKYKHSLIVNIANEALQVNWSGNPTAALATYKTTYENIITNLRNVVGFNFPIMIDAPDCGQTSDAFVTSNTATYLNNIDPLHNLIFSSHAYWYGYANNDSLQMANKINAVLALDLPFVLGEISNQQDDNTPCEYNLNYQPLLNYCETNQVSWLAWSWDKDICPDRQMSADGTFSNLTTFGLDIVNNTSYGMLTHPRAKSNYLLNNGCGNAGFENSNLDQITIYPNPSNGIFQLNSNYVIKEVQAFDIAGKSIPVQLSNNTLKLNAESGSYILKLTMVFLHNAFSLTNNKD
jgi:mannan endo-1,4-beta-mannosidase